MQAVLQFLDSLPLWLLGVLLFGTFWLAALLGRVLHKRSSAETGDPGLIVSASLGLLALLLGFTVSMAVSRYDGRRAAVLAEANAIGTFLYRTDLMPADVRGRVQAALEPYLDARIRVGRMYEAATDAAAARQEGMAAQGEMWRKMMEAGAQVPDPAIRILLVESANAMFDSATARDAALGNRLPPTLILLLLAFPIASLVLIGYVSGRSIGVHLMASTELILLLTLVLLLIADLNQPRSGTIITPQQPLIDVQDQLRHSRAQAQETTGG